MSSPPGRRAEGGGDMRDPFQVGAPTPERYRIGPLGSYVDRLAARLSERQYARDTARRKIRVVTDLSRWLESRRLDAGSMDDRLIARFFRRRRRYDPVRCGDTAAVRLLLELLRDLGVLPEQSGGRGGSHPHPAEIRFEQYLRQERRPSPPAPPNTPPLLTRFPPARLGPGASSPAG